MLERFVATVFLALILRMFGLINFVAIGNNEQKIRFKI